MSSVLGTIAIFGSWIGDPFFIFTDRGSKIDDPFFIFTDRGSAIRFYFYGSDRFRMDRDHDPAQHNVVSVWYIEAILKSKNQKFEVLCDKLLLQKIIIIRETNFH